SKILTASLYLLSTSDCFFVSAAGCAMAGEIKPKWPTAQITGGANRSPSTSTAMGVAIYLLIPMAASNAQIPGLRRNPGVKPALQQPPVREDCVQSRAIARIDCTP